MGRPAWLGQHPTVYAGRSRRPSGAGSADDGDVLRLRRTRPDRSVHYHDEPRHVRGSAPRAAVGGRTVKMSARVRLPPPLPVCFLALVVVTCWLLSPQPPLRVPSVLLLRLG